MLGGGLAGWVKTGGVRGWVKTIEGAPRGHWALVWAAIKREKIQNKPSLLDFCLEGNAGWVRGHRA